jgi:hypothetical protein
MSNRFNKGSSNLDGIAIIMILILIFISSVTSGDKNEKESSGGKQANQQVEYSASQISSGKISDIYKSIYIDFGNASYSYQPSEEYITINNSSERAINITGWKLRNGKNLRPYDSGVTLRRFPSDEVAIPRGTFFITSFGASVLNDILLAPNETAIITTGRMGAEIPYKIVSFKENICSGYLGTMPEYSFTPPLRRDCPRPTNEPGIQNLDTICRDFISRLSTCRTPTFNARDNEGNTCTTCVNGERLTLLCKNFIKEHYSYAGCLANHLSNPKFSGDTWRIFLNQGWDQVGNLVRQVTY